MDSRKRQAVWKGAHSLGYHIYITLSGYDLQDAVAFAYGANLQLMETAEEVQAGVL